MRDDRLRSRELLVLAAVEERDDLTAVDNFFQQRPADEKIRRLRRILPSQFDVVECRAIRTEKRHRGARRMQQADDAIENEFEQIAHRAVGKKFERERVENARAFGAALFAVDLDRQVRRMRVAVDGNHLRLHFVGVEDHLAVAEGDAIARAERDGLGDFHSVHQRAVYAAAVADEPLPTITNDFRVASREEAIFDRDRAVGCATEGDHVARDGDLLRSDSRLIDRETHRRSGLRGACIHRESF